jgi:Bacterial protein of unknown function (DUF885)
MAGRLEGLAAVVRAAEARLGSVPGRPISRFHTEMALRDIGGIDLLVAEALELASSETADEAAIAIRPRLDSAAVEAGRAVEHFRRHLEANVRPASEGEGRLGRTRFDAKLAHVFSDPAMTSERILAEAERQYVAVRADMVRLARELWPAWRRREPPPVDDGDAVRGVFDLIAAEHPAASDLLTFCRAEVARIEGFCRDQAIIGLADEPLEIQWTPVFLRSFGGAMLKSPGPLDKGERAFYSITPPGDDWPAARVESYLRENNRRLLRLITIHEAVPGHYLQGVYGNRAASILRSVLGNGVYAEGWAVYITQVMIDAGFDADDPALALTHWKYYLRAVINAIIDVRIHTAGMSEDEAVGLMVDGGFQEEAEARAKYDRARLTSTQLSTYFVGSNGMWELEAEARRRAASASGDPRGASAVPRPAIVGGYPATPGFDRRRHLESVLGGGELPLPLLRRALFDR